jgi:hypothetical protein
MAVMYVGKSVAAAVASGNLTLTEPASICRAGDLLVAIIAYRSNVAFANPAGSTWTTIATQQSSGNTNTTAASGIGSGHVAYHLRGASTPTDRVFTRTLGDVALGGIFAFRYVDQSTPIDNSASITIAAASTTANTLNLWTPGVARTMIVQCMMGGADITCSAWSTSGGTIDQLNGAWQEVNDSLTTTGADTTLGVAYAYSRDTTAITSCNFTGSGSTRNVRFAFGIRPAARPGLEGMLGVSVS